VKPLSKEFKERTYKQILHYKGIFDRLTKEAAKEGVELDALILF